METTSRWTIFLPGFSGSQNTVKVGFKHVKNFLIFYLKLEKKTSASFIAEWSTPVHTTFWLAPLQMELPAVLIPLICVLVGNVFLQAVIMS
jgi:hypothetical protein